MHGSCYNAIFSLLQHLKKMVRCLFLGLLLSSCVYSNPVMASSITLRLGPPGVGNGGPNPLGIPPSIVDMELTYLTKSGFETSLAAIPGLLFGFRTNAGPGLYASLGGGVLISANGVGPGMYAGFGSDFWCGWVCFNAEYKQAIGITTKHIIAPYALRVGISVRW